MRVGIGEHFIRQPGSRHNNVFASLHTRFEILDISLQELIVQVIHDHIHIGLLAGAQIIQAADLIA